MSYHSFIVKETQMKRLAAVALCLLFVFVLGCSKDSQVAELDKKNQELTERVKNLENHLLEAQKKQVQLQIALQDVNGRLRDVERDFDKIRFGQSSR